MNREFLLNILFLIFVNLLIKPFYVFGIELAIQNKVGQEIYGTYFTFFNFTLVLQIINDLGIQYFNNRHLSQHEHLLEKYFPPMLFAKGLLGIAYFLIILIIGLAAWHEWSVWALLPWLLPIAFNQLLNSLLLFLRSTLSGLAMYRTDSLISILDRSLLILICLILFQISPVFHIQWFIYAQTSSLLITITIAFFSFHKRLNIFKIRINWILLRLILKESFPYALTVLLMGAYSRIDGVLLERLLPNGKVESGVYAGAYRLLDAANMLGFLFASLLLPMFARMLKQQQAIGQLLQFSFQLIFAGALPAVITIIFFRHPIMYGLLRHATPASGEVLALLMLSFLAYCSIYIYGSLLTANRNLLQINRIFLIALGSNVLLNLLLIPSFRAIGAALAAVLTQSFVAFGQMIFVHRQLKIPFALASLWRLLAHAALSVLINFLVIKFLSFPWVLQMLLAAGISLAAAFPLGLLQPKALLELFKNDKN